MTDRSLDGRRVLITGGSMGIGLACTEAVLHAGGRVVIAARGEAALAAAVESCAARGEVHGFAADVGHPAEVDALFAVVTDRLGGLDGVLHAAAVLDPIGAADAVDGEAWWAAVRTNLFGSYLVATGAARRMSVGSSIVLMSGGGATSPFPNFSAYGASKAAVVRLAETLAIELAERGIRVNSLAPGFVATRMQEQTLAAGDRAGRAYAESVRRRLAEGAVPPQLAAEAAVFLLGDASAGITGRLLAAPWDDWRAWPRHRAQIESSDVFTLRRIVPSDRDLNLS